MPPSAPSGLPSRRDRWRAEAGPRKSAPVSFGRTAWTIASLLLLLVIALIVVRWMMRAGEPRTAIFQVSIDDYGKEGLGLVQPLPFGREDSEALEGLAVDRWRTVKSLGGVDTRDAISGLDPKGQFQGEEIDKGDVFIGAIRGQTVVVKGSGRSKDGSAWEAALLPEDFKISDNGRPVSNAVPLRKVVEQAVATPAATTLVVLDLGDLRWDPRLGVVAGLVPRQLETEIADWKLPSTPGQGRAAWLLTSHDAFEFSGVSVAARRSFFSRALELALAGKADDRAYGGDEDRWVELHELVAFVCAQTDAWARADSNKAHGQHPVLWRLFDSKQKQPTAARIDPAAVPKGIRITRVKPRNPLPTAQIGGESVKSDAKAKDTAAKDTAAKDTAAKDTAAKDTAAKDAPGKDAAPAGDSTPPADAPTSAAWSLFDAVAGRRVSATPIAGGEDEPSVLAYAPHLWRALESQAAAGQAATWLASKEKDTGQWLETMNKLVEWSKAPPQSRASLVGHRLLQSLAKAREKQVESGRPWKNNDVDVREAVDTANRGLETAWAVYGWKASRTAGVDHLEVETKFLENIVSLRSLLEKVEKTETEGAGDGKEAWRTELRRAKSKVEETLKSIRSTVDEDVDERIRRLEAGTKTKGRWSGSAEIRSLASSRVLTAAQRRKLEALLETLDDSHATPSTEDRKGGDEAEETAKVEPRDERWLPPIPAAKPGAPKARSGAWDNIAEHLEWFTRLFAIGERELPEEIADRIKEIRNASDDPSRLTATLEAGWTFARMQQESATMPSGEGRGPKTDRLLRRLDPRDVERLDGGDTAAGTAVLGWLPFVPKRTGSLIAGPAAPKTEFSLKLAVTADADGTVGRLGGHENRVERSTLQLGGGAPAAWEGARVSLWAFPSRTTRWTFELGNDTGKVRDVSVELVRLAEPDPRFPPAPAERSALWNQFLAAIAAGRPVAGGMKVLGRVDRLTLTPDRSVLLPPLVPPLASAPPGAAPAGTADTAAPTAAELTGSLLALVVRDQAKPASPEPATADGPPAPSPPKRPPEPAQTWVFPIEVSVRHPRDYVQAQASISRDGTLAIDATVDEAHPGDLPVGQEILVAASDRPGRLAARQRELAWLELEQNKTTLRRESLRGQIRGLWKGRRDDKALIVLDVDGYPRSHVFEVAVGQTKDAARSWAGIAIVKPAAGPGKTGAQAFENDASVPLALAIDFPFEQGNLPLSAIVTLQNRGPGGGQPDERWKTTVDRRITHQLAPPENATLAVDTAVADWTTDLDAGMQDTDARVEARVTGDDPQRDAADRSDVRDIVIDGQPPRLEPQVPADKVIKGQPYRWILQVIDGEKKPRGPGDGNVGSSGIDRVEWGLDDKRSGTPVEPAKAPAPRGGGKVSIDVPTADLKTGPHHFVARAFDGLGHPSEPVTLDLDVCDPPPPPPAAAMAKEGEGGDAPPPPKPNTLVVTVTVNGGRPREEVSITVKGPSGTKTEKTVGGQATFPNLKPGPYIVKGPTKVTQTNKLFEPAQASVTVTVEPGPPKASASLDYK